MSDIVKMLEQRKTAMTVGEVAGLRQHPPPSTPPPVSRSSPKCHRQRPHSRVIALTDGYLRLRVKLWFRCW